MMYQNVGKIAITLLSHILLHELGNILPYDVELKVHHCSCLYLVEVGVLVSIGNNRHLKTFWLRVYNR